MSTRARKTGQAAGLPVNEDVAFESEDVKAAGVLHFLAYLALTLVATLAVCAVILHFAWTQIAKHDAPPPPVRQGLPAPLPPEPRLQAQGLPNSYHNDDPQQDLRDKVKADREALDKTGWVDETAGIAQIPIEDAMKIIAEKGLPAAAPQPSGAAPRRVGAAPKSPPKK